LYSKTSIAHLKTRIIVITPKIRDGIRKAKSFNPNIITDTDVTIKCGIDLKLSFPEGYCGIPVSIKVSTNDAVPASSIHKEWLPKPNNLNKIAATITEKNSSFLPNIFLNSDRFSSSDFIFTVLYGNVSWIKISVLFNCRR